MKSKIFENGGGAGIGSYVIVCRDHEIVDANPARIRQEFDAGNTLYLSLIDDSTDECLMPLTGYVEDGILYLTCRDFDDNKQYAISIHAETNYYKVEISNGISIGDTTIPTSGGTQLYKHQTTIKDIDKEVWDVTFITNSSTSLANQLISSITYGYISGFVLNGGNCSIVSIGSDTECPTICYIDPYGSAEIITPDDGYFGSEDTVTAL